MNNHDIVDYLIWKNSHNFPQVNTGDFSICSKWCIPFFTIS